MIVQNKYLSTWGVTFVMENIYLNVRLRPIRFAFLVDPNDMQAAINIFRINTCLWGGRYNLIVPFFNEVPSWWWNRSPRTENNALQIINGYLNFFEPDFIVEQKEGWGKQLGFDKNRIFQLKDFFENSPESALGKYGLTVHELYRHLHYKYFQYVRHEEYRVNYFSQEEDNLLGFRACHFGLFPVEPHLDFFEKNYVEAFKAESIEFSAQTCRKIYESNQITPLLIGSEEIHARYHQTFKERSFFILDISEAKDLIDFWNLRAVRENILPIPIQFIDELYPFFNDKSNGSSSLPAFQIYNNFIFSRSIKNNDIEKVTNQPSPRKNTKFSIQQWYPPIWRKSSDMVSGEHRPTLKAADKEFKIKFNNSDKYIEFDHLHPDFSQNTSRHPQWANVINITSHEDKGGIATAFPVNHKTNLFGGSYGRLSPLDDIINTKEGLVMFPLHRSDHGMLELHNGDDAIGKWLSSLGCQHSSSDAGNVPREIIRNLGGLNDLRVLTTPNIIETLDEVSKKPNKSISVKSLHGRFKQYNKTPVGDKKLQKLLTNSGMLKIGLNIKCTKCNKDTWHSLEEVNYELTCGFCLQSFHFPSVDTQKYATWHYRLSGPFSIGGYAGGGYAAALSIRCLSDCVLPSLQLKTVWSCGKELTISGEKYEADFILWSQRVGLTKNSHTTEVVFGEVKSNALEAFGEKDINRMEVFAKCFPGAILVFATLREDDPFSNEAIEKIKKLAEWGREYDHNVQGSRSPVILLTGVELFSPFKLYMTWGEKNEKYKNVIESHPAGADLGNLRVLADITQQLYLDMPSYSNWIAAKYNDTKNK